MATDAGLRFAGQEGSITLINATTGDALLPDMPLESIEWDFPFELTKKQFVGQTGPTYREFADGYELKIKFEPNAADQYVDVVNALKAKAEGLSTDEFAIGAKFVSPGGGTFRITFKDPHWEKAPGGSVGGRTEFIGSELSAKGSKYKIATV